MKFQKGVLLKNYTTFKIGGRAKYFVKVKSEKDLINAVKRAKHLNLPFFILGGGSNLLVEDEGYKGLVIKVENSKMKVQEESSKFIFHCQAGTLLANLISKSSKIGAAGVEWAVGIPGTIGGAVWGNAGAFGKSMKDIVKSVNVLVAKEIKKPGGHKLVVIKNKKIENKDCKFGYRDSIFKKNKNLIILSAEIELQKGDKNKIRKKMKEFILKRKKTQPLNFLSSGSVFKNFIESKNKSAKNIISSGELIEKCGLKGKKIGRAQISKKHANFIVNLGGAKAKDVIELINLAKKEVKKKFKLILKEEIQLLKDC